MGHLQGLAALAIDCADDAAGLARWWQGLLGGGEIETDDEGNASLSVAGYPGLDFLLVPETKTVKNRLHLDIRATDFDAAIADAVAHGATLAPDVYDGGRWQVLRDPQGNEFCILKPRPAPTG